MLGFLKTLHSIKKQKQALGVDRLLPWYALIDDNIILNKDGSFLVVFNYFAPDCSNISRAEVDQIALKINQAAKMLGDGFVLYFDLVRLLTSQYPLSSENFFPDDVSRAIDDERRMQFTQANKHHECQYVLGLLYTGHQKKMDQLHTWLFNPAEQEAKNFQRELNAFKAKVAEFTDFLKHTLRLSPMNALKHDEYVQSELCQYLHFCFTGENVPLKMRLPLLDLHQKMGNRDFLTGAIAKVGQKFVQVIALDEFPEQAYTGILSSLDALNVEFRWSTRFICMDKLSSEQALKTIEKSWDEKVYSYRDLMLAKMGMIPGRANRDAHAMSEDANDALNEGRGGYVAYGYYTSVIVLMHEDVEILKSQTRFVVEVIQNIHGFNARIETLNTEEAFLGSLMGNIRHNVRKTPMHTLNLATLVQTSSIYTGEAYSPNPFLKEKSPPLAYARTNGSNPYRLNLYHQDVGHTMIVGPTGSGKSTLLAFLLAQFLRYKDARVFAFDKKESLYAITKAVGGKHFHIGKDSMQLAPFAVTDDVNHITWLTEYIAKLVALEGIVMTPRQKMNALQSLRGLADANHASLTSLILQIADADIGHALKSFAQDGVLGGLLDGGKTDIQINHFNTFELDGLLNMGNKNLVAVLGYLFYWIEKQLDGRPTVIALEEVWLVMMRDFFKDKFTEWLVTLRKQNCSVWFTCQNLAQLYGDISTLASVIDSTATKIFLANPNAAEKGTNDRPGAFDLYQMFGLTEFEIENVVTKLHPKRDYYIKQEKGSRAVQFDFGEVAMKYCGLSGSEALEAFKKRERSVLGGGDARD